MVMEKKSATTKQKRYLAKLGVDERELPHLSQGAAGFLIHEILNQTGGDCVLPHGEYVGKTVRDVPQWYLKWALDSANFGKHTNQQIRKFLFGKE